MGVPSQAAMSGRSSGHLYLCLDSWLKAQVFHFGRCLCVYRLNHLRHTSSSCHPCWLRCRAFAWSALTSHASADVPEHFILARKVRRVFARKTGGFFCWESFIPFQWRKTDSCLASKQNAILARISSKCHRSLLCKICSKLTQSLVLS